MILTKDDFVSHRINWKSKVMNLLELAEELSVSTSDICFIDDSELECHLMKTSRPEVFTIRTPSVSAEFESFIANMWILDKLKVTEEDGRRTGMYQQEKKRREFKEASVEIDQYLSKLELHVSMNVLDSENIDRVVQLSQRTNQFNSTGNRIKKVEIENSMQHPNVTCWVIHVEDRFGYYGLVGCLITESTDDLLVVREFMLSCRILGRGVEDAIMSGLKQLCLDKHLHQLKISFGRTEKNDPFTQFVARYCLPQESNGAGYECFVNCSSIPSAVSTLQFYFNVHFNQNVESRASSYVQSNTVASQIPNVDHNLPENLTSSYTLLTEEFIPYNLLHEHMYFPFLWNTAESLINEIQNRKEQTHSSRLPQKGLLFNEMFDETLSKIWQQVLGGQFPKFDDHFFSSGGDSISAMRLISKIFNEFHIEIPFGWFFENPSISAVNNFIKENKNKKVDSSVNQISTSLIDYPVSGLQKRIWISSHFKGGNVAYNIHSAYSLKGKLNQQFLEAAFNLLTTRHEILRTIFYLGDGDVKQRVLSPGKIKIRHINIGSGILEEAVLSEISIGFDLGTGPLFRVTIIQNDEGKLILVFVIHHIIADGWSLAILFKEVLGYYNALELNAINASVPELPFQYKDFVLANQTNKTSEAYLRDREYWLNKYGKLLAGSNLTKNSPGQKQGDSFQGHSISFFLADVMHQKLIKISDKCGVSLFSIFVAAANLMHFSFSGNRGMLAGTIVADRERIDSDEQIGPYTSTLLISTLYEEGMSLSSFLNKTFDVVKSALAHKAYTYFDFIEDLNFSAKDGTMPLLDLIIIYNKYDYFTGHINTDSTLSVEEFPIEYVQARFDLTLNFELKDKDLQISIVGRSGIYSIETLQDLSDSLQKAIDFISNEESMIADNFNQVYNGKKIGFTKLDDFEFLF